MGPAQRVIAASLLCLLVNAGCVKAPPGSVKTDDTTQQDELLSSMSPAGLPMVNPPYPGPYSTVVVDGAELLEGRFQPGQAGGTLVRSMFQDPKTFNPWVSSDVQSSQLSGLMWRGLVGVDPWTGDVIPDMAKEFKVEPDGVTYTTRLREGLKWSDGRPVTAEDVAFTWNTIVAGGYGNASLRDVVTIDGKMPEVTVVDKLTNKFVTPKPFAPFQRLLGIQIAPKHIVEPIIKRKDGRMAFNRLWSVNDAKNFVTTGPYVLSSYREGQRAEFKPAPNFFWVDKNRKALPKIAKLVYLSIPDIKTGFLKFRNKELDLEGIRPAEVANVLPVQEKENFKVYNLGPSVATTFIMFNLNRRLNPKGKAYVDAAKSKWFNDVNFRQAVNHALDRESIVENYYRGLGAPLYGAEPIPSPWLNKSLKPIARDIDYAMKLLEKSGFRKRADGFLYDSEGHKVEFTLLGNAGSPFVETVGPMIVNDLKQLGMKVNTQIIAFNILADKVENSLDWEAAIFALSAGDPLEPNDGSNVWKSSGRLHLFDQRLPDKDGKVTVTDARDWEKRLDEIFSEGASTLDKAKRKEIYNQYQQIIYEQAPFVYLASPLALVGVRNTLGNYVPTMLSQSSAGIHNIEEIYIKQ